MLRKTRVKEETMVRTKKERWSSGHGYCAAKTTREAPRYLNTWKLCKLHKRAYLSWAHKYAKNVLLCVHIYIWVYVYVCVSVPLALLWCAQICANSSLSCFFFIYFKGINKDKTSMESHDSNAFKFPSVLELFSWPSQHHQWVSMILLSLWLALAST